ncbi:MAG: hypothetical protein OEW70_01890 [candidate division WOR-3 bacterium]|nr:hypothetical protein [candidate division WOR-3 bacterium]
MRRVNAANKNIVLGEILFSCFSCGLLNSKMSLAITDTTTTMNQKFYCLADYNFNPLV